MSFRPKRPATWLCISTRPGTIHLVTHVHLGVVGGGRTSPRLPTASILPSFTRTTPLLMTSWPFHSQTATFLGVDREAAARRRRPGGPRPGWRSRGPRARSPAAGASAEVARRGAGGAEAESEEGEQSCLLHGGAWLFTAIFVGDLLTVDEDADDDLWRDGAGGRRNAPGRRPDRPGGSPRGRGPSAWSRRPRVRARTATAGESPLATAMETWSS